MTRIRSFLPALALVSVASVAAAVSGAGIGTVAAGAQQTTTNDGVTRVELAQGPAANAPGQTLYLQEVRIAPGAELATHFHEGTQVASIRKGTLTYEIVEGSATVTRADGTVETFEAPATIRLRRGDALLEPENDVHRGANRTEKPIVIIVGALLAEGAPLATPVESPPG